MKLKFVLRDKIAHDGNIIVGKDSDDNNVIKHMGLDTLKFFPVTGEEFHEVDPNTGQRLNGHPVFFGGMVNNPDNLDQYGKPIPEYVYSAMGILEISIPSGSDLSEYVIGKEFWIDVSAVEG